ncbi:MAG: NAD-dependent epimerase/dehydratase family protein [Anaerolineales bacterium]|nr:NAD-dependent epimerase/dehydratase family protein [Anaerolineales bacterium]
MSRRVIAITGISGYLGQLLLPHLEKDPDVERVIGIDVRPPPDASQWDKLTYKQLDTRDAGIEDTFEDSNVLIHMAFKLWRRPGDRDVDAVNIYGSQNVFNAAVRAGVRKLIFTSSTVAYGIHPDNPVPLTEKTPLRPNDELYYSRAKAACERMLAEIEQQNPNMIITILRPTAIAGPNAPRKQLEPYVSDTVIVVRGYDPPGQFLHEDDMIRALLLAIRKDLPGIFNVTSDDPQSLRQSVLTRGGRVISLPLALLRPLLWVMWQTGSSIAGPEWLLLNLYPFVATSEKLRNEGWKPEFTTPQTYHSVVQAFRVGSQHSVGELEGSI